MPGKQTEGTEKASETQSGSGAVSDNGFTEYAFAISVDVADALPRLGMIEINSLFVAVWNTERTVYWHKWALVIFRVCCNSWTHDL